MKHLAPVLFLCLLLPANAHAYSDPGSGLMLWQLAVSFVVGLLFYCRRIVSAIARLFKNDR